MGRLKKVWKVLRWTVLVVLCLFAFAQFIRPVKTNPSTQASLALESYIHVDSEVAQILDRSCNDCHSNKTRWPWYTNVSPVSWFVIDHVNDGRRHLNFSEWGRYDRREQRGLLAEIGKEVEGGSMPLSSYTPMHSGSKLSGEDVVTLRQWTRRSIQQLQ